MMRSVEGFLSSVHRVFFTVLMGGLISASGTYGATVQTMLVKTTDRTGMDSYEVLTREQLLERQQLYRGETGFAAMALRKAQQAWKEANPDAGSFPRSVAQPPKIKVIKTFRNAAEAEEALQDYQAKLDKSKVEDAEKLKRKYTRTVSSKGKGGKKGKSRQVFDKGRYEKAVKEEAEKAALLEQASDLYESLLKEGREEAEARLRGK